jgi:hypothetical protein
MNKQTNLFDYRATVTAADGYPFEVIRGSFGPAAVPYGYTNHSWGSGGKIVAVGDQMKPLPDTLRLSYYSYTEDCFYYLKTPLPVERLQELLASHFPNRRDKRKEMTYSSFTVSIAPCGLIGVWLKGSAGFIEIGQFRAQKEDWDFEKVFSTWSWSREKSYKSEFDDMYSFIQKEITEKRLSSAYWESLSKKYRWKLIFNMPEFALYDYGLDLINIERRPADSNGNWLTEINEKAIPNELLLWIKQDKNKLRYWVVVELVEPYDPKDKEEEKQVVREMNRCRKLISFFDNFYAEVGDAEVSLVVEFDENMKSAKLKLKTAEKEAEVPDCKVRMYCSDEYNIDD